VPRNHTILSRLTDLESGSICVDWTGVFATRLRQHHLLSEDGGEALGSQAGEARLANVCKKAGFGEFRRGKATPFNLILEAKVLDSTYHSFLVGRFRIAEEKSKIFTLSY
jgi:hypothetical protein